MPEKNEAHDRRAICPTSESGTKRSSNNASGHVRIAQELESSKVKTTAAGNQVLDAVATGHHSDIAIATALGTMHRRRSRLDGWRGIGECYRLPADWPVLRALACRLLREREGAGGVGVRDTLDHLTDTPIKSLNA